MKKILAAFGLCLVAVACNAPGENDDVGSSDNALESNRESTVTKKGPPTCIGWACASGSRPVSDDELFDLIAKQESAGTGNGPSTPPSGGSDANTGTPPSGGTDSSPPPPPAGARKVSLSSISCVTIPNACVRSCEIRTSCGGGGYVGPNESATVFDWIRQHGAKEDGPVWAKRSATGNVTCTKVIKPGAKAKCTVDLNAPPPDGPTDDPGDPSKPPVKQ